ncbi:LysR family transcriptional regulator [Aureimonas altamirensis]|uniref:LysR family transcriptional regulator n=1 Tax=Aureimonas altamirensis TaxID=370622 RepID=UPI001E3B2F39|nr:LysR family transcriptional regulator [Aureimonas altamirensis]UHD43884.1 LysR family transcriptional regulator [Aureimonas altamirensis]
MNETTDWDDLRLFLAVAKAGGLGAATVATGKSAPTLGRRMLALERRMGCELFVRLPRGYELTKQGEQLLEKVIGVEQAIAPLLSPSEVVRPIVKISAGHWVTYLLCQRAAEIAGEDTVLLRFIAADHALDIGRREAVIGIRNVRPEQAGLAVRRIGSVRFSVYALDRSVETWVRVIGTTPSARWVEANIEGAPSIEVTNPRNALDLALAGSVRVVLPTFLGRSVPDLQEIAPPIAELDHDQWLVTHHEDRFLPQVRKINDRVYRLLRRELQGGAA